MPDVLVSYPVPYVCQFASPELVRAFIYGQCEIETDSGWAAYGAESPQEYAYWAVRACGVVCVKMTVEAITGQPSGTVIEWIKAGLAIDGYLVELRPERTDRPVEKGWKHAALAQLMIDAGCNAGLAADLSIADIADNIRADRLVIASVSSELGENGPVTRNSGHLVVVHGIEVGEQGEIEGVIIHNPSGRMTELQRSAHIPAARFADAFSGRGIVVGAA